MSKWCGKIGFVTTVETEPGLWEDNHVVEKKYYGDVLSNKWRRQPASDKVNDDINITNQISIVADPYATNHVSSIAWIEFSNEKWKVTDVDIQYPRLILSIGGVYNG